MKGGYAFQSEYAWLSKFYPCNIEIEGQRFLSVEQAYQFAKATGLGDTNLATMIMRTKYAKEVQKLGGGKEFNPAWDSQKIDVMRTIVNEKFMQNPSLCDKLVQTGQSTLIEATMDGFWAAKATLNSKSLKKGTWQGANFIGKILMEVRTELRRELGLPDPPPKEDSNTTAAPPAASQTPHLEGAESAVSNPNAGFKTNITTSVPGDRDSAPYQTSKNNQTQTPKQTPGRGKKNKNHQSPILSPDSRNTQGSAGQKGKKVRIYSRNSALPPKNPIVGNFFACLAEESTVKVSMV